MLVFNTGSKGYPIYSVFKENNLILRLFTHPKTPSEGTEITFGYLTKEPHAEFENLPVCDPIDTVFLGEHPEISDEEQKKVLDCLIKEILTKRDGVIEVGEICDNALKQISNGSFFCELPSLKRKDGESIIFKIEDGFFIFFSSENLLQVYTTPETDSIINLSVIRKDEDRAEYLPHPFVAIEVPENKDSFEIMREIAEAIANNERLVDIPKLLNK